MGYITSQSLLRRAHIELDAAHRHDSPREQFIHAHMAGLRAAASVLELNSAPTTSRRKKVRSAWEQLSELGPQWEPWVDHYTGSAVTRAALESGRLPDVSSSQASDAIGVASRFIAVVEEHLAEKEAAFRALAAAS